MFLTYLLSMSTDNSKLNCFFLILYNITKILLQTLTSNLINDSSVKNNFLFVYDIRLQSVLIILSHHEYGMYYIT